ncbi:MAG: hypothetical protein KKA67_08975 [Spirochaetes bacterium]|nr:hypothetical protein [Spirochaetota bacterium]MBU1081502.1 hypothetical protein [Spirochaetota bacterium]
MGLNGRTACIAAFVMGVLSLTSCASAPTPSAIDEVTTTIRRLSIEEVRAFSRGSLNPLIEWKSIISKSTNKFIALEFSMLRSDPATVKISAIAASADGQVIESKTLFKDDLLQYWRPFVGEDLNAAFYKIIDRKTLDASFKVQAGKRYRGIFVLSIPKDSAGIDECLVRCIVNGEPIEIIVKNAL